MGAGRRAILVRGAVMRSARRSPFCSRAGGVDTRGMAPDPRIWGEVWGIAGRVMYDPLAAEPCDVLRDREGFVGRQSIEDQLQGLAASAQHPAQQVHEQRAGQGVSISGAPGGRVPHVLPWTASARMPDSS